MNQIKEFFAPFIGQVVWQLRRGHGSFLAMEFGVPHLIVREPIVPRPDTSGKVRRNLQRRHVDIAGDWHFWVQYGDWQISTAGGVPTSEDPPGRSTNVCAISTGKGWFPSTPASGTGARVLLRFRRDFGNKAFDRNS